MNYYDLPLGDQTPGLVNFVVEIPKGTRNKIEYFFSIYKELEGKDTLLFGWLGAEKARETILEAYEKYLANH